MKKKLNKQLLIPVILFVAFFILGVRVFRDYGVMVDDPMERFTSLTVFNFLFPYTCTEAEQNEACPEKVDLYTYRDKNYGSFLQQPMDLIEYLKHYQMDLKTVIQMRHLWIFLNVFLSQIFFFFLLKKRFKSMWAGIFGVLIFIFSPRLFANSFYNIKDLMFYAWFVISLFFLYKFLEKPNWRSALLLGITSAVAVNTRIIGAVIPAMAVFFLLQDIFQHRISRRQFFLSLICLSFSVILVWILITPVSWKNPLTGFWNIIRETSDFQRQKDEPLLYMGKIVRAGKLPWHFLPVWMVITIPCVPLLLNFLGFFFLLRKKISEPLTANKQLDETFLLIMVLIPAYVMVRRPIIYDGWRHFFFLFSGIIYFCVFMIEKLENKKSKVISALLYGALLLSFFVTGRWMIQNHPYEGTYFSPIARNYTIRNFAKDYWRMTSNECLNFIADVNQNNRITIWEDGTMMRSTQYNLDHTDRSRIIYGTYGYGGAPADYVVKNYVNDTSDDQTYPFYKAVHHVRMDGFKLASVFERDHSEEIDISAAADRVQSNVNQDLTELISDGDEKTGWTTGTPQKAGNSLEIQLNGHYNLYGLTILPGAQDSEYPHQLEIETSNDGGNTWQAADVTWARIMDYAFEPVQANAVRLRLTADDDAAWTVNDLLLYKK